MTHPRHFFSDPFDVTDARYFAPHRSRIIRESEQHRPSTIELLDKSASASGLLTIAADLWWIHRFDHSRFATQGMITFRLNRTPLWKPTPGGGPAMPVRSAVRVM